MAISNQLLKLLNQKRELLYISEQSNDITTAINSLQGLAESEVFSQDEASQLIEAYRESISSEVERIISTLEDEANNIAQTSLIEANDRVKNITITIAGTPVILPPPQTYLTQNINILSTQEILSIQVNLLIDKIKEIVD